MEDSDTNMVDGSVDDSTEPLVEAVEDGDADPMQGTLSNLSAVLPLACCADATGLRLQVSQHLASPRCTVQKARLQFLLQIQPEASIRWGV